MGSEEKQKWCQDELGFDYVINCKKENLSVAISWIAPDGVGICFDNVDGDYYHTITDHHMRKRGRVLMCGSMQTFNSTDAQLCKQNLRIHLNPFSFLISTSFLSFSQIQGQMFRFSSASYKQRDSLFSPMTMKWNAASLPWAQQHTRSPLSPNNTALAAWLWNSRTVRMNNSNQFKWINLDTFQTWSIFISGFALSTGWASLDSFNFFQFLSSSLNWLHLCFYSDLFSLFW